MVPTSLGGPTGRARCCFACAALVLWPTCFAAAQPMVRVRAGSRIELRGAQGADGIELRGTLVDDLGAPLSGRRIDLSVAPDVSAASPVQRTLRSADDGSFGTAIALPRGRYQARARFAGDAHTLQSAVARPLDLSRLDVQLRFVEPREPRLDLDAQQAAIAVVARPEREAAGLDVRIEDERGRVLANGRTDALGVFRVQLPSSALGPAAMGELSARTGGDAARSPAETTLPLLRYRRTSLTLVAQVEDERVLLHGTLQTRQQRLPNKAIGLFDGPEHLATVMTDARGRFRYAAVGLREPGGRGQTLHLQARFASDASWLGSSRSESLTLSLAPEQVPSALWLLAPLVASAAALWWLSRRQRRTQTAFTPPSPERSVGIHIARARIGARADRLRLEGSVLDAHSAQAISGATLQLQTAHGQRIELRSDASGRFRSPELAVGQWLLRASAPGYAMLEGALSVPHRGQWADAELRLQSLRSAAVLAYKPAAIRALPSPELWEVWTPRETLTRGLRGGRVTESFVQLTERLERAAYASSLPTEADVDAIGAAARQQGERPTEPGSTEG
jgi:hypothetical protein